MQHVCGGMVVAISKPSFGFPPPVLHGCCWETFYIFAYFGLVGNPHLTAIIIFLLHFNVNQVWVLVFPSPQTPLADSSRVVWP